MRYIAKVSDVFPGFINTNFPLDFPPDSIGSKYGGATVSVCARAFRGQCCRMKLSLSHAWETAWAPIIGKVSEIATVVLNAKGTPHHPVLDRSFILFLQISRSVYHVV